MNPIPLGPPVTFPVFDPVSIDPFGPVELEQWNIHGAQDELCLQYDGTVWPRFEGPMPEDDTHPNCVCTRDRFEY